MKKRAKKHPATFPVALVEQLLECYMPETSYTPIVLDCFAGSGSTLIASDRKSYKGAGIDINPGYQKEFYKNYQEECKHFCRHNKKDVEK